MNSFICFKLLLLYSLLLAHLVSAEDLGKIVPTNPDEKGEAVNSINRLRAAATPFAQQMPCSLWDETLVAKAKAKALLCDLSKQTDSEAVSFDVIRPRYSNVIRKWNEEQYELFSDRCFDTDIERPCLNYKVVLNERSEKFGCAMAECSNELSHQLAGFVTVCLFDTPLGTDKPYTPGTACSNCTTGYQCLIKTLCCQTKIDLSIPDPNANANHGAQVHPHQKI